MSVIGEGGSHSVRLPLVPDQPVGDEGEGPVDARPSHGNVVPTSVRHGDVLGELKGKKVFIWSGVFLEETARCVPSRHISHLFFLLNLTAALSENPFQWKTRDRKEQPRHKGPYNSIIFLLIIQSLLEV